MKAELADYLNKETEKRRESNMANYYVQWTEHHAVVIKARGENDALNKFNDGLYDSDDDNITEMSDPIAEKE